MTIKICNKRTINTLFFLFISLLSYQCKNKNERLGSMDITRIERVSKNEVVISWDSKDVYEGVVYYKISGKEKGRPTSGKDSKESTHHKVVISDLSPSTTYNYWLKNSKTRYTFQTMPENTKPFSFIISVADSTEDLTHLIKSENCGFMLSMGGSDKNKHIKENSFVPVFYQEGANTEQKDESSSLDYSKLDWGDLHLVMINKVSESYTYLNSQDSHTIGIIMKAGLLSENKDEMKRSAFHQNIVSFNKKITGTCGCPPIVAFVGIVNYPINNFELDGINYFSIPSYNTNKGNAIVISIDGESVSAYYPSSEKELILRMPPEHSRRICNECRRLADKSLYEESVKAYRDFIDNNQEKFNTEDAFLSVAKIYDENLFKFKEASEWYKNIKDKFSESTSALYAKQRLRYLKKNSDYNFVPLQKFEKLKSDFAQTKENSTRQQGGIKKFNSVQKKLVNEAEGILTQYSDCKISSGIMLWLANQYQQADYKKALEYYKRLIAKDKDFSRKNEILVKIGETFNYAGQYKEARSAFLEAIKDNPEKSDTVKMKLKRVETSIRRTVIRNFAWILALIILLLCLLIKPTGIVIPKIKLLLIICGAYIYTFIIVFFVLREEITETFNSYNEIILFFIAFILLLILSLIASATYSMKLRSKYIHLSGLIGALAGTMLFVTIFYLLMYYIYPQYLEFVNL